MGRIATYGIIALVVVLTASYGSEVSRGVLEKFHDAPDQACQMIEPIQSVIEAITVPIGAQHKKEIVWRQDAPENFQAVLPLMQAVTVTPCDFQSGVEIKKETSLSIRAMRLIERDPKSGNEQVVSEVTDFSQSGKATFVGRLYPRIPYWYQGDASEPTPDMVSADGRVLVLDLSKAPRSIYHGWTEPQVTVKPGMNYLVEMEVKIVGPVRLQMGIDYWRSIGANDLGWKANCQETNHCEGHLSRWFGPTDGWQTIRAPKALMP